MRGRAVGPAVVGLLLVLAPWTGRGELGAQEDPDGRGAALDGHLRRLVPYGFSGAVLVVEGGERLHAGGYGLANREAGRPVTPETVFLIGSLSKQFTAAAVMALVERGVLSVDDAIDEHLPGVPEDKRGITLHHLLTHTSGLPEFHDTEGDYEVMDREAAERAILGAELAFAPGEEWSYSNAGYSLLAAILERVAGRPFEAVLREEVFEPAGLERTGYAFEPLWEDAPVARGYTAAGDQGSPLEWAATDELWALIGNGGILSTVEDLERWDRALREGTVLAPATVERLFAPHAPVRQGLHAGYGWLVEEDAPGGPVVRHGGANDFGFGTRWRRERGSDRLVVVLVNRQPPGTDVSLATGAVEDLVWSVVSGEAVEPLPEVGDAGAPDDLERYAGRYRLDAGGELMVRPAPGALAVEPRGSEAVARLAFPAATDTELETVRRLDRLSAEILDGIARDDWGPLARAMADSSRVGAYREYIAGWWGEMTEAGAGREDLEVIGTAPVWWSPGDERLATVVRATAGGRSAFFRIHWRDGRVAGLGGGAVREPATTLFAPTAPGELVGYHLGIREPVRLSFEPGPAGEVTGLRLETAAGTIEARRLDD